MDTVGALGETIVFLDHFRPLPDPRQRSKVIYPLEEVLLLCLLAVLAGAESVVDIARFGTKKRELLRRFRPFTDRRMTNSATSSRRLTRRNSSSASSPGSRPARRPT